MRSVALCRIYPSRLVLYRGQRSSSTSTAGDQVEHPDAETPKKKLRTRLSERHRILAEGGIPPVAYEFEKEKWSMRERFAQFGLASGINPGHLWPTIEEVEDMKALRMYRKAKEAMKIAEESKANEKRKFDERLKEIDRKLEKYPEELAEYEASLQKGDEEITDQKLAQQKRLLDVQEYFGYRINPKDPKFAVVLAQKEVEEKQAARAAKKLAAEKRKKLAEIKAK